MNTKSIRFRLTVWYALAFSAASAIIFSSFYFITKGAFFSQTDATLSLHTQNIAEIVKRQTTPMHKMMIKEVFLSQYSDSPGMLVVIMNDSGNIVSSSLAVKQTDQVFNQLYQESQNSKTPFYKNASLNDIPMRFYVQPVYEQDNLRAVVLMAHPMDVIQKSLNRTLFTIEGVFIIFLIPTVLGGYLLAKGSMQPIAAMAQKLKEITSENLNERIKNPNTNDEIEELSTTFNDLLDRLHKAFIREKQFIADVAHELKTPLATQRSQIEVVLSKERLKEDYRNALFEMLIDNQKMTNTLKNILDLAWSETDSTKKQGEVFNLSNLIEELKDLAKTLAGKKQINIEGVIEPDVQIFGKKEKLGRAILNIIDNAIKYTKEGKVSISLNKRQNKAIVKVKDTGVGISKTDLPYVFERFFRGSKTDKTVGSGLGLAIAKSIIQAHQGSIDIKSIINKGTTVTILLPIAENIS